MKTKGTNSEVCHMWASQSQQSMSNANGSLYFEGDIIYSYGSHFPIANRIDNNTVLFTTEDYSNTTSKHKTEVWRACKHLTIFYVPHLYGGSDNFNDYQNRFNDLIGKSSRARKYTSMYLEQAMKLANEANNYAEYFKLENRINTGDIDLDDIQASIDKLNAEKERKEKERKAQIIEDSKLKVAAWRKGENVGNLPYELGFLLRVKDGRVETSQRADIPLEKAVKLWPLILRARKNKTIYKPDNLMLGHYRLDHIDKLGNIRVGCHFIKFEELHHIAQELGL